jgi:putative ABC transport system substrate-binding protein
MNRRQFITLVGAAGSWPLVARAQQERTRRIGILMGYAEGDREGEAFVAAFRDGLQKLGWMENRNISIEARWGAGSAERNEQFAKELVGLRPDLILSHSTVTTAAILKQTHTIAVIFANVTDPIGSGFVASLPRPGGNATGFVNMEDSMSGKWVGLLKEVGPHIRKVAFLFNPNTAPYFHYYMDALKAAAPSFGIEPAAAPITDPADFEPLMAALARQGGGMIVMTDNFTTTHRATITSLAARYGVPTIYPYRFFAELGGLISYGSDTPDNFRRAAGYADRILKGASPNELPVQAPVKFELVVNLKAAKALGLQVSLSLQQRADEVIE